MPVSRDYSSFLTSFGSSKFQALWPAQAHVLSAYNDAYTSKPDVAIELPTGAGKTLIALLIAEAWRQEGKKVAVLSANKTLARQMKREADLLKIQAALMEGSRANIPAADIRAYGRASSVVIMNYWVYFNQNPSIDWADLIIMDDAHLAEYCLHSLYSLEIDYYTHKNLFKSIVTELRDHFPDYPVLSDALADDAPASAKAELLSFLDQCAIAERLREMIDSSPDVGEPHHLTDFGFRWQRIRHRLREANIYLSTTSIWIRPYVYPLRSNLMYEQATQRLYMSATIGDSGDLSRRLGVQQVEKIPVPAAYSDMTMGRRLVVMNRIAEEDIPSRFEAAILAALRIHPKSVWLCSSKDDARKYERVVSEWLNQSGLVGHPTWILTPEGDEIDAFKQAPKGHLFVAGRFDGMDFLADECRLVILTTLPRAVNLQEEFITTYLRDAGFMRHRLNQRIVQALGRCNRSAEDFGVYLLADRRFATHFGPESNKAGIPANIIAELDMAQDAAEIQESELVRQVEAFMRGDFGAYDQALASYLAAVPASPGSSPAPVEGSAADTLAEKEVLGWVALFESLYYEIAAHTFEACWETARARKILEMGAFHGWNWAKALYLASLRGEPGAREKALQVMEEALNRGGRSPWFNRQRASIMRARNASVGASRWPQQDCAESLLQRFDDLLEVLGTRGNRFERWCARLTEQLSSEKHKIYQMGLVALGDLLAYHATRAEYQASADCRWRGSFGNAREVITFEAKIEHDPSQQITASDMGQAHIQLARAASEFQAQGYTLRGTIVTHLTTLGPGVASSAGGIKIVEKQAVLELWNRVRALLSLYRDQWSLEEIAAREVSAQRIRPGIPEAGWLVRALDANEVMITAERLCAEWPGEAGQAQP
jgi:hypothetical protein